MQVRRMGKILIIWILIPLALTLALGYLGEADHPYLWLGLSVFIYVVWWILLGFILVVTNIRKENRLMQGLRRMLWPERRDLRYYLIPLLPILIYITGMIGPVTPGEWIQVSLFIAGLYITLMRAAWMIEDTLNRYRDIESGYSDQSFVHPMREGYYRKDRS